METMPTMHATMTSKIEKTNNAAVAMANSTKKTTTMSTKKITVPTLAAATMADATIAATTMKVATMDNQSTHLQ
jgi:hypothetical protein